MNIAKNALEIHARAARLGLAMNITEALECAQSPMTADEFEDFARSQGFAAPMVRAPRSVILCEDPTRDALEIVGLFRQIGEAAGLPVDAVGAYALAKTTTPTRYAHEFGVELRAA